MFANSDREREIQVFHSLHKVGRNGIKNQVVHEQQFIP